MNKSKLLFYPIVLFLTLFLLSGLAQAAKSFTWNLQNQTNDALDITFLAYRVDFFSGGMQGNGDGYAKGKLFQNASSDPLTGTALSSVFPDTSRWSSKICRPSDDKCFIIDIGCNMTNADVGNNPILEINITQVDGIYKLTPVIKPGRLAKCRSDFSSI